LAWKVPDTKGILSVYLDIDVIVQFMGSWLVEELAELVYWPPGMVKS
jgi:hypothetical protein